MFLFYIIRQLDEVLQHFVAVSLVNHDVDFKVINKDRSKNKGYC